MIRLERYLQSYHRENMNFACIIFGDFNNRLVCADWLKEHVSWNGEGSLKTPVLKTSGAQALFQRLATPEGRAEVLRTMDSRFFEGIDATGRKIEIPEACLKMSQL